MLGNLVHGVISLAVAAAGWVGFRSPGDYATITFPPLPRHDQSLDVEKVGRIAESILEEGQNTPVLVRENGNRYVLVEGLHRLEALKSLGEITVDGYVVQARKH
jgi:sulfiredoxin